MTKKIILILLLCGLVISCGKKGDPKYESHFKKIKAQNNISIII